MTTIVSLHAHPDDETLLSGGWLAQRAAAGDRVVLLYATDGSAGLAAHSFGGQGAELGSQRRAEAQAAAQTLGVARVAWLGWGDSGMAQAPTGGSHRFVDTDVDEVARVVADVLDDERATVLTGYDAKGGYGHPDHVHVHRVARAARLLAIRPPQLLEATIDRTWLVRGLRILRPFGWLLRGLELPADDIYSARSPHLVRMDVRDQVPAKLTALKAHASQASGGVRTLRILTALPAPVARRALGREWFLEVE